MKGEIYGCKRIEEAGLSESISTSLFPLATNFIFHFAHWRKEIPLRAVYYPKCTMGLVLMYYCFRVR
ncbi:hypothetical protein Barb6XT_01560 [Bacteroidales bacterium Barb6XT]|nr:hypothetical protein Barb6XT_01560 [Bacteroidales bacterium Barb6XT]